MTVGTFPVLSLLPKQRFLEANPKIPDWMPVRHWEECDVLFRQRPSGFQGVLAVGNPLPTGVLTSSGLQIVQLVGAGYDQVDTATALTRGLIVCNNAGANAQSVAEHILMSLLYFARRQGEGQLTVYSGTFAQARSNLMGPQLRELSEMTIGIVGLGSIGQRFAELVLPFDARVLYYSRSRNLGQESALNVEYQELDTLLSESDAVAVTLPLTPDTHRLFNGRRFKLMKPTSIFINVGRGGVVDHDALIEALTGRQIYAASLDVYDQEPLPLNHPLLLAGDSIRTRLLLSPHIAGVTHRAWKTMIQRAVDNLVCYARGDEPHSVVVSPWVSMTRG